MRIFGGEKISSLMTRFKMDEETPLTHPLVSKALEQIQIKVEGYNFDVRKSLVEYDDVINKQRQIVYNLRDNTLINNFEKNSKNEGEVFKSLGKQIQKSIKIYFDPLKNQVDWNKFVLEFSEILPMIESDRDKLTQVLNKEPNPSAFLLEKLKKLWEERVKYFGPDISQDVLRYTIISTIDPLWVEHLTALDDLRDGVRLRGYAQRDPLIEYRKEGFEMFQNLMNQYESNLSKKLFRIQVENTSQQTAPQNATEIRGEVQDPASVVTNTVDQIKDKPKQVISGQKTQGRNDPCWCGSGKKWKKCHYPELN
jgi:preprotein translocase subunit SecA